MLLLRIAIITTKKKNFIHLNYRKKKEKKETRRILPNPRHKENLEVEQAGLLGKPTWACSPSIRDGLSARASHILRRLGLSESYAWTFLGFAPHITKFGGHASEP